MIRAWRYLLLVFAGAVVSTGSVRAGATYAVIEIANAVEDASVTYRLGWGQPGEPYTVDPQTHISHYYRYDTETRGSYPIPSISFTGGADQPERRYTLRAKDSDATDRGGNVYVFRKRVDDNGRDTIELVALTRFVDTTMESVAAKLARKDYESVIKECGIVIKLVDSDARIFNYRGRARYLLKLYDAAIEDFTRAIALHADEAIYHSNRGFSYLGTREVEKALADFEVALRFQPDLTNAQRGRALAIDQRESARAAGDDDDRGRERKSPVRFQETRFDVSAGSNTVRPVPKLFEPFITPEAFHALETFRLGSKVDYDENRRLQAAYDKAYEEGRYIDAQEANYIRAIEREPVAALWKMLSRPAGNHYYLPKFTPVEERTEWAQAAARRQGLG